MSEKNNKHNFMEYSFSKDVVDTFPELIQASNEFLEKIRPYSKYTAIWLMIQAVEDGKMTMLLQYDYYSNVYENKGKEA